MHRSVLPIFLLALTPHLWAQPPELTPAPAGSTSPVAYTRQWMTIHSSILGQTRHVVVALPASFQKTHLPRRYPVAVIFDGEYVLGRVATAAAELIRQGQIPELVLIGIENIDDMDGRVHDLTPPGLSVSGSSLNEGGDRFLDFIERELLPAADRQFRTSSARVLIGLSSGGILATYAAATRSSFRSVISLDAPTHLGDHWLPKKFIAKTAQKPQPLHYAAYAARFDWPADLWKQLVASAPSSWKLHYEKLPHENHNSIILLGSYLGLREVFLSYSKLAAPEFPNTSILPYYDKLTDEFGAVMEPPQALMTDVVEDLLIEGRGAAARTVFDRMVTSYGEPAGASETRRKIAEMERRPPPSETVESLLETPFSSPEEVKDWIGEWKGEAWMNEYGRHKLELRIRIENGRVEGEVVQHPVKGVDLVTKLQYLKAEPGQLTYGFMNGMRPRGMLLWTIRKKGEYFEGESRWGGVSFKHPDGSDPPVEHVRFRKAG